MFDAMFYSILVSNTALRLLQKLQSLAKYAHEMIYVGFYDFLNVISFSDLSAYVDDYSMYVMILYSV